MYYEAATIRRPGLALGLRSPTWAVSGPGSPGSATRQTETSRTPADACRVSRRPARQRGRRVHTSWLGWPASGAEARGTLANNRQAAARDVLDEDRRVPDRAPGDDSRHPGLLSALA